MGEPLNSSDVDTINGSTVEQSPPPPSGPAADADYDPEREVDEDIKAITSVCDAWKAADDMASTAGNTAQEECHRALGEIFVRSASTDEDPEKRGILIAKVKEHPEVWDSNRYKPSDHSAAELHLTLQFGLKDRRGAKSNWKRVIEAAEIELKQGKIADRSLAAFATWFADEGMRGAREVLARASGKADAKRAAIEALQGVQFELPEVWMCDEDIAPGRALLLVDILERGKNGSPVAEALGVHRDEGMSTRVADAIVRKQKAIEKANLAMAQHEMEDRDTDAFPANLLIPKALRKHFDGRTRYAHEDERNEFLRERKLEQQQIRKKRGKFKVKQQHELGRRRKDQARVPLNPSVNWKLEKAVAEKPALGPVGSEPAKLRSQVDDGFDAEAYFAEKLGVRD